MHSGLRHARRCLRGWFAGVTCPESATFVFTVFAGFSGIGTIFTLVPPHTRVIFFEQESHNQKRSYKKGRESVRRCPHVGRRNDEEEFTLMKKAELLRALRIGALGKHGAPPQISSSRVHPDPEFSR